MLTHECFLGRNSDSRQELCGRDRKHSAESQSDMKTLLLLLLMSTIVMIAYLAVPARPVADAETGQ